jgi:hypothetical protein
MEGAIVPSVLDVTNMTYAEEQYGDFVNINSPILSLSQFKEKRGLPLNEKCADIFYSKTAHLGDNDFIKIDREMLQLIGFANTFKAKKDSEGNLKLDANGNPKLEDKRQDFNNSIRCLRATVGFIEGTSLDDINAHFVIQKLAHLPGRANHGGQNRQDLWIRMRALEHFIIMANTQNSFMVREYFLDLKRIMVEYNMYLSVYRSKSELSLKECKITCLIEEMRSQREQMNELIMQSKKTETEITQQNVEMKQQNTDMKHTLDRVMDTVTRIEDKVVLPAQNPKVKELMVIMHSSEDRTMYIALRTQLKYKKEAIKQCRKHNGSHFEEAFEILSYQNPRNLFHRFKDYVQADATLRASVKFRRTMFQTSLILDDIKTILFELEKSFQESINSL